MKYVIALDQGTTSSRTVLFNNLGDIVAVRQQEFPQLFPSPGRVEHNPLEIWESQLFTMTMLLKEENISPDDIKAIGITNQRETTIVWDKNTGEPVYNAIVWQDRRTAEYCEELKRQGLEELFKNKTGLVLDAYFSATKISWILNNVPSAKEKAFSGDLLFGTVDTWLLYKLTAGRVHATDVTNASRTLLYNIHELKWDDELLDLLQIPRQMLPEVLPSIGYFGALEKEWLGAEVPVFGMAGDQQAALFGQLCKEEGMAKNTYGTGCFMLMNTGKRIIKSDKGLLTTIAWGVENEVFYAIEGSVFVAGAVIQWMRDQLGLIQKAADSEALANSIPDNGGVYLVPAFTGLGTPHWDMFARGALLGLTRGSSKAHLVRAALESIVFQTCDVLDTMQMESGIPLQSLQVDGGAASNGFLMQFQSDMLNIPLLRAANTEATAQGAAFMAGVGAGLWKEEDLPSILRQGTHFYPAMEKSQRDNLKKHWKKAVKRALNWEEKNNFLR